MPLHSINLNILKVKGRSDLFLYLEIIKKAVHGITLLITFRYGVTAILIGQIVISFLNYIPNSYFSSKLLGYSVREQVSDFFPILFSAALASYSGYALNGLFNIHPVFTILIASLLMCSLYLAMVYVFQRTAMNVAIQFFGQFLNRNR